jgi:type II secretion system protein G
MRKFRLGFTLIEVLIVVVVMAILAAVVLPRFSDSANDAKKALLRQHLHTVRSQIELYKLQHNGAVPSAFGSLQQLTKATNAAGGVSPTGEVTATYTLGPYLKKLPQQPFSGLATVTTVGATTNPTFTAAPGAGWIYQAGTGKFWVNHQDYQTW